MRPLFPRPSEEWALISLAGMRCSQYPPQQGQYPPQQGQQGYNQQGYSQQWWAACSGLHAERSSNGTVRHLPLTAKWVLLCCRNPNQQGGNMQQGYGNPGQGFQGG